MIPSRFVPMMLIWYLIFLLIRLRLWLVTRFPSQYKVSFLLEGRISKKHCYYWPERQKSLATPVSRAAGIWPNPRKYQKTGTQPNFIVPKKPVHRFQIGTMWEIHNEGNPLIEKPMCHVRHLSICPCTPWCMWYTALRGGNGWQMDSKRITWIP